MRALFPMRFVCLALIFLGLLNPVLAAQQKPRKATELKGQVLDESGAGLAGVEVMLTDAAGKVLQTVTADLGAFEFTGLTPSEYTLKVAASGFTPFQSGSFKVGDAPLTPFVIKLAVESTMEQVNVDASAPIGLASDNNASAVTFKGKDLESLPEDPDELASALQELAGPSAGPGGAQLFVDGFNGIRLPPKSAIREIRINSNPFSSEYDRPGFGRIEILTKPGIDQLRGEAQFNFNDESLNGRNAFAPFRAPLQVRRYGGNLSGSIIPKKASFFLDFERREVDENATINAQILDGNLNPIPFSSVVVTPQRQLNFSGRIDYQIDEKNTLVGRYSFFRNTNENQGIGNFSLASRSFNNATNNNTVNASLTTIFNPKVINEARIQLIRQATDTIGDNSLPSINVAGAFNGGGAQVGVNDNFNTRLEFQDYISLTLGTHALKTGVRVRGSRLSVSNTGNFGGTYIFAGDVERNAQGQPSGGPITSLEQYRRVLLGLPGYRPSQFTLQAGDPFASVNQWDAGLFFQDEWRARQNLTLSYGLRYEAQTNLGAKYNFAPRLGLAYSPFNNKSGRPATVIRAGFGIFYDRFDDNLTLQSRRLDGVRVTNFFIQNPGFFPNIPTLDQLQARPSIRQLVDPNLTTPYSMQATFSVEQQLPLKLTGSFSYVWTRDVQQLRSRNINAPRPGGVRPLGNIGDIYQYESGGIGKQHQIRIGVNRQFGGRFTIFSNYTWTKAESNTDGVGTFPADGVDFGREFGTSSFQARHFFFIGGSYTLPYAIRVSSFNVFNSGRPFNITTGRDNNGDTIFTDRPSFAAAGTPGAITTPFGTFNPNPLPGETLIPRNFGEGPGAARVNLTVSRTFGFGSKASKESFAPGGGSQMIAGPGGGGRPGGGGPGGGGPGGGGGGRGFGGMGDAAATDKRFNLTLTVQVTNLFNRTNLGNFNGALTSPFFGRSNFAQEARRVSLQMRFRF